MKFYFDELLENNATSIRIKTGGKVIAKAFYQEDFSMDLENNWGAQELSIMEAIMEGINSGRQFVRTIERDVKQVREMTGWGGPVSKGTKQRTNAKLWNAHDFFVKFNGSSINIPVDVNVVYLNDTESKDIFKGPAGKEYLGLKLLLDHSIGELKAEDWSNGATAEEFAPNGYNAPINAFNKGISGTFNVEFGLNAFIPRLIMNSVRLKVSNQVATNGQPLFIIASINFRPAFRWYKYELDSMIRKA